MNSHPHKIKIMILEDNGFYNNILTRKLSTYTDNMCEGKDYEVEISSFTNYFDFVRNLKRDLDIAIVDYFLGQGITGKDAIKHLKTQCPESKIIIISQSQNLDAGVASPIQNSDAYIYKDTRAFDKSCHIVEEMINDKLKRNQNNKYS